MGRANCHSLFTYKAGFSSFSISFSNLWELGACYVGKGNTRLSARVTPPVPPVAVAVSHTRSAPSAAVETPGWFSRQWWFPQKLPFRFSEPATSHFSCSRKISSVVLKETLIPNVGSQGCWVLTTSNLEWTGTALPLKCWRDQAGCRAAWDRSQRCVRHLASFTGWTAGII